MQYYFVHDLLCNSWFRSGSTSLKSLDAAYLGVIELINVQIISLKFYFAHDLLCNSWRSALSPKDKFMVTVATMKNFIDM